MFLFPRCQIQEQNVEQSNECEESAEVLNADETDNGEPGHMN